MKKSFLILISFCTCIWLLVAQEQSFIMSRKKEPTISAQECAENLGCIMRIFPNLIRECAELQAFLSDELNVILNHLDGYIDGDKECFLQKSSKNQRAEFNKNIVAIKKELEEIQGRVTQIKNQVLKHLTLLKNT